MCERERGGGKRDSVRERKRERERERGRERVLSPLYQYTLHVHRK